MVQQNFLAAGAGAGGDCTCEGTRRGRVIISGSADAILAEAQALVALVPKRALGRLRGRQLHNQFCVQLQLSIHSTVDLRVQYVTQVQVNISR